MDAAETKPKGTMGRSQYLLNRSKQRFKQRHTGDGGSGNEDNFFVESRSAGASSPMGGSSARSSPTHAGEQRSTSRHQGHEQRQQYEQHYQQQQQQQQQYQDHNERDHQPNNRQQQRPPQELDHSYEEEKLHNNQMQKQLSPKAGRPNVGSPKVGRSSDSGSLRQQDELSQEEEQLQQLLERQRYEHQQQQLQLRQEQLRQQEQLRWQQKQLQMQQDQLRQQEQMRQTRQQQQIRNQKVHHQQRQVFHEKQKQLREQQHTLDKEFQQQEEGLKQQMEVQKQQQELLRQKELRAQKKERMRLQQQQRKGGHGLLYGNDFYEKVAKGLWIQQQQQLFQQQQEDMDAVLDETEGVDDLHDLCKAMKHPSPTNRLRPTSAFFADDSSANSRQRNRGVTLDVRNVAEALSFLDRASRLQIPSHLANTLESLSTIPIQKGISNAKEHAMRRAIAVRQEKKGFGNDYASLQKTYAQSVSSGYTDSMRFSSRSYLPANISNNMLQNNSSSNARAFGGGMVIPEPGLSGPMSRAGQRRNSLALSDSSSSTPDIEQSSTITTRKDMFEEDPNMARKNSLAIVDTSFMVDPNTQIQTASREAVPSERPNGVPASRKDVTKPVQPASSMPDHHNYNQGENETYHLKSKSAPDFYISTSQQDFDEKEKVPPMAEATPLHRNTKDVANRGDMRSPSPTFGRSPSPNRGLSPDTELSALAGSRVIDAGGASSRLDTVASHNFEEISRTSPNDEDLSFPSLKHSDAISDPNRHGRARAPRRNSGSRAPSPSGSRGRIPSRGPSPSRAPSPSPSRGPSPSPSDVLMTYTVTENDDDDTRTFSSQSRQSRKSGVTSIKSQRSVSVRNRIRNHPPMLMRVEKRRGHVENFEERFETSEILDSRPKAETLGVLPPSPDPYRDDSAILPQRPRSHSLQGYHNNKSRSRSRSPPSGTHREISREIPRHPSLPGTQMKSKSRSRSRTNSRSSSSGSSRGEISREIPRYPTTSRVDIQQRGKDPSEEEEGSLSNDFTGTSFEETTHPSRRTMDDYRSADKDEIPYNLSRELSAELEDTTSYGQTLSDSFREDSSHSLLPRYRQSSRSRRGRDPMADYEDASRSFGGPTDEDDSLFSSSYLDGGDDNYRPGKGTESFFSSDMNTSHNNRRLDHQQRHRHHRPDMVLPYNSFRTTGESSSVLSPPPAAAHPKNNLKNTSRTKRYVPPGIPARRGAESEGVGLLLFEQESVTLNISPLHSPRSGGNKNEDDADDLDEWLESAMASQSINGDDTEVLGINSSTALHHGRGGRTGGGDDEADLDAWLDNIISR